MIDVVSSMAAARGEILTFAKSVLDDSSMKWIRELLSEINKQALRGDDEFCAKALPLYRNVLRFFNDFCDEVTPGGILATFYISAIELGVRDVGDSCETLQQFVDEVDMEDWNLMDKEYAIKFDIRSSVLLSQKWLGISTDSALWAGGLITMNALSII